MRELIDLERANIEQLLGLRTYLLTVPVTELQKHLNWQNPAFFDTTYLEEQIAGMQPGDLYQ